MNFFLHFSVHLPQKKAPTFLPSHNQGQSTQSSWEIGSIYNECSYKNFRKRLSPSLFPSHFISLSHFPSHFISLSPYTLLSPFLSLYHTFSLPLSLFLSYSPSNIFSSVLLFSVYLYLPLLSDRQGLILVFFSPLCKYKCIKLKNWVSPLKGSKMIILSHFSLLSALVEFLGSWSNSKTLLLLKIKTTN